MLFLIVYLLTTLYIKVQAVKVELVYDAIVTICPGKIGSTEIMDGNKHTLAEAINYTCEYPEIEINLIEPTFAFNTVIIYGGGSITDDGVIYGSGGFSVTFDDNEKCGMFAKLPNMNISEMRVNCKLSYDAIRNVFIKLDHPLYITEIEFHSVGTIQINDRPMIYRGCFQNFPDPIYSFGIQQFGECGIECGIYPYAYLAVKNNTMCYCRRTFEEVNMLENARCSFDCSIPGYSCGGPDAYSVYLVLVQLPYLVGCSDTNLTHDIIFDKMNASYCIAYCDENYYALVKNGIQCVCENHIVSSSYIGGSACNISCPGDPTSVCGGADVWSVYETCISTEILECSKLFHCDIWDKFGLCQTDCYEGYSGEYCADIGYNFTVPITLPTDEVIDSDSLPTQTEEVITENTYIGENWSTPINSTDENKDQKKDRFFLSQFFFIAIAMSIFGFAVFLILLWVSSKLAFG